VRCSGGRKKLKRGASGKFSLRFAAKSLKEGDGGNNKTKQATAIETNQLRGANGVFKRGAERS
jgi:hypothetical protein